MQLTSVLLFLDLGAGEVFVIVLVVLLFFGSKKIPDLARGLGKGMREFRDATNNIKREIEDSTKDIKKDIDVDITKDLKN